MNQAAADFFHCQTLSFVRQGPLIRHDAQPGAPPKLLGAQRGHIHEKESALDGWGWF